MNRHIGLLWAGASFAGLAAPALAAQLSAPFVAHVNVQTSCSITAQGLDFGNVGTIAGGETAIATVNVVCSAGTPYSISFNPVVSVTAFTSQMNNGGSHVAYSAALSAAGGTGPAIHTITGILAAQATPPAGAYTDNRIVYLNY